MDVMDEEEIPTVIPTTNESSSNLDVSSIMNMLSSMTPSKAKDYLAMLPENVMPSAIRSAMMSVVDQAMGAASGGTVNKEALLAAIQSALAPLGIDPMAMAKQFLSQKAAITGTNPVKDGAQILWIKDNRSVATRKVSGKTLDQTAKMLIKGEPVSMPWSRLAIGPWKGKNVRIWYNQGCSGKMNRRTKLILGYASASDVLIHVDDHAGTEKELEAVEKLLRASTGVLE